jgi:hypothetical protein
MFLQRLHRRNDNGTGRRELNTDEVRKSGNGIDNRKPDLNGASNSVRYMKTGAVDLKSNDSNRKAAISTGSGSPNEEEQHVSLKTPASDSPGEEGRDVPLNAPNSQSLPQVVEYNPESDKTPTDIIPTSTAESTPPDRPQDSTTQSITTTNQHGISHGAVAAIVLALILLALISANIYFAIIKRNKRKRGKLSPTFFSETVISEPARDAAMNRSNSASSGPEIWVSPPASPNQSMIETLGGPRLALRQRVSIVSMLENRSL